MSVASSRDFDARLLIPLLTKVINNAPDADIWHAVIDLVTPPSSKHVRLYSTTSSVYRELQKGWNEDYFPASLDALHLLIRGAIALADQPRRERLTLVDIDRVVKKKPFIENKVK